MHRGTQAWSSTEGRSGRPLRAPAAVLAGAAVTVWAAGAPGCAEPDRGPPNVLLVVVDTLRADCLGCYGAERDLSPAIDALAAEGVRFERAYSTAPWTKPAVGSLLTGLYPSGHGASAIGKALPLEVETLAEILAKRGYETAGVVSNFVLTALNGFGQGFGVYSETGAQGRDHVSTGGVTAQALDLIEEFAVSERPFFLFVHYFDPHYRYMPHPELGLAAERAGRLDGDEPIWKLRRMAEELSDAEVGFLRDLYDGEVRFTDAGIGRLLEGLEGLGLADETVVIFTADHGEEFFERGWLGHMRTLYEELIRVPLIVRAPSAEPKVVSRPVSIVSVAPTILELAGIDPSDRRLHGASLAGSIRGRGGERDGELVFAEVDFAPQHRALQPARAVKKAIVGERFKLIRDEDTGAVEVYDLASDPGERRDLASQNGDLARRLLPLLDEEARRAADRSTRAPELELSERQLEMLHDLGYVEP